MRRRTFITLLGGVSPLRNSRLAVIRLRRMLTRLGLAAKMPFGIHPHMPRHSTGFKLANQGVDTRSLQQSFLPSGSAVFWKD